MLVRFGPVGHQHRELGALKLQSLRENLEAVSRIDEMKFLRAPAAPYRFTQRRSHSYFGPRAPVDTDSGQSQGAAMRRQGVQRSVGCRIVRLAGRAEQRSQ